MISDARDFAVGIHRVKVAINPDAAVSQAFLVVAAGIYHAVDDIETQHIAMCFVGSRTRRTKSILSAISADAGKKQPHRGFLS